MRELDEELGIKALAGDLRRAGGRRVTLRSGGGSFIDDEFTDVYVTRFDGPPGTLKIDAGEVEEVRFIGRGELSQLMDDESFERVFVPHGREYYRWVMELAP